MYCKQYPKKRKVYKMIAVVATAAVLLTGCSRAADSMTESELQVVTETESKSEAKTEQATVFQPSIAPTKTMESTLTSTQETTLQQSTTQEASQSVAQSAAQMTTQALTQISTQVSTPASTPAPTQPSTPALTEPAKQWSLEDPEVMAALKASLVKWINYYRQQERPGYPDLVRNFDIDKVYQVRTEQNAAAGKLEHNSKEEALIATTLKVGIYVEHPSCVPMRFISDNTMWGDLNGGDPIYVTLFWEALGFNAPAGINATASTPEEAVDLLARRIAKGYNNSKEHWNYIGGHKNGGEIAVGACLGSKDGMNGIYTAVAVRDIEYNYYYDENNVWTYYPNGIY